MDELGGEHLSELREVGGEGERLGSIISLLKTDSSKMEGAGPSFSGRTLLSFTKTQVLLSGYLPSSFADPLFCVHFRLIKQAKHNKIKLPNAPKTIRDARHP